ncbi:MAG TPA: cupin domain-containing protein [Terriglobales bacterium]|nr:cupin domain-containing protein [Terriglobales bacterium]
MKRNLAITLMLLAILTSMPKMKAQSVTTWDAKTITWQRVDPDGTKWAVLEGDKDEPGKLFSYAFFIPAGYWEHHWHSQDARVAVIAGTLKVAIGDELDKEGAKSYPVGSYLLVPANVEHTMGADVDTIIIGTAAGPWKTHHHKEHHHLPQLAIARLGRRRTLELLADSGALVAARNKLFVEGERGLALNAVMQSAWRRNLWRIG